MIKALRKVGIEEISLKEYIRNPSPGFLPGKSYGQRGLVAYSLVHWVTRVEHDLATKQEQNIQNSTGNILNGEESDTTSLASGAIKVCTLLQKVLFNIILKVLTSTIGKKKKERKNIETRKKEIKLSLFRDGTIAQIENPKEKEKCS